MRARVPSALALVALLLAPAVVADESDAERVERALAFLARAWAPEQRVVTPNVVEALAQAGVDPKTWPTPQASAWDALVPMDPTPGDAFRGYKSALRIVHAMGTSGYAPPSSRLAEVERGYVGDQFGDPSTVNDDMWAILALRSADAPRDARWEQAAANVREARLKDGGWASSALASESSTDMTGMALVALAVVGPIADDPAGALLESRYHPATQGYGANAGTKGNCQSTVWAIHGLRALGRPVPPQAFQFLRSLQNTDGGFGVAPGAASDIWCTSEAIILLSGARYPLPAFAPAAVSLGAPRALDPSTLTVGGPFERATWTLGGAKAAGTTATHTFPAGGKVAWSVLAEGPLARHRASGELTVRSAAPTLALASDAMAGLRHVPVLLDASGSRDPEGEPLRLDVEWGDGAAATGQGLASAHAYALPGRYEGRARAVDPHGEASAWSAFVVTVRNRAPTLDAPARVVADRANDVVLAPAAIDPDDEPVTLRWTFAEATGEGAPRFRPTALGEHPLVVVARDPFGGETRATITIDVQNLLPVIANATASTPREGEPVLLAARVTDPDGPEPAIVWRVGNATFDGARAEALLSPGDHVAVLEARDTDGGVTTATLAIRVLERDAPTPEPTARPAPPPHDDAPPPAPARPGPLAAPSLDVGIIVAGRPSRLALVPVVDATAYRFEFGDGHARDWSPDTTALHAWAAPGAVEVRLHARADDGRTSTTLLVLHVAPPPAPSARAAPAEPDAAPAEAPREDAPEDAAPEAALEASTLPPPRREAPGPGAPLVALLAAIVSALARRARA